MEEFFTIDQGAPAIDKVLLDEHAAELEQLPSTDNQKLLQLQGFMSHRYFAVLRANGISDVSFLYTFDGNGELGQFRGEASSEGQITLLSGPGPLHVVGRFAYFQLFDIDPRGLFPSMVELQVIANLTNALIDLVIESNEDTVTTVPPTFGTSRPPSLPTVTTVPPTFGTSRPPSPPTVTTVPPTFGTSRPPSPPTVTTVPPTFGTSRPPSPPTVTTVPPTFGTSRPPSPPNRKRRQANDVFTDILSDDVLNMALENERACNPPLRITATSLLQEVERVDSPRLVCLRLSASMDCRNAE